MKEYSIGVFDCTVGGLALVNELNLLLPSEKVIYFSEKLKSDATADEKESLKNCTIDKIDFIKKYNVKAVVSCCSDINSAWGMKMPLTDITYSGTFLPAAQSACAVTRNNKIAVMGSSKIIKKGCYAKIIKNIRQNITVMGVACPYLSGMKEDDTNFINKEDFIKSTSDIFEKLREEKVDVVIVADGYYHLITDEIKKLAEGSFELISPYEETAKKIYNDLLGEDLLTDSEETADNIIYFDENEALHKKAVSFFLKRTTELKPID